MISMSTLVTPAEMVVGETYTIGRPNKPGCVSFTVVALAEGPVVKYDGATMAVTCDDGRVRNYSRNWRVFRPAGGNAKAVFFRGTGECSCTERVKLVVPTTFFEDHARRDLLAHPTEGVQLSKGVRVELCPDDIAELLSDARHYVDGGTQTFGPEALGLISSARATVAKLVKLAH